MTFTNVTLMLLLIFTNAPLEETIEIILKRICINKEITTDIPK